MHVADGLWAECGQNGGLWGSRAIFTHGLVALDWFWVLLDKIVPTMGTLPQLDNQHAATLHQAHFWAVLGTKWADNGQREDEQIWPCYSDEKLAHVAHWIPASSGLSQRGLGGKKASSLLPPHICHPAHLLQPPSNVSTHDHGCLDVSLLPIVFSPTSEPSSKHHIVRAAQASTFSSNTHLVSALASSRSCELLGSL